MRRYDHPLNPDAIDPAEGLSELDDYGLSLEIELLEGLVTDADVRRSVRHKCERRLLLAQQEKAKRC